MRVWYNETGKELFLDRFVKENTDSPGKIEVQPSAFTLF
jgi:hypothetical protein